MNNKIVMRALPAALLCLGTGSSFAAGFQLLEQNVSGLGNSYAGSAAVAEDASTVFFNPAGMAYLPAGQKSFVVGLNAIKPSSKLSNGASSAPTPTLQPIANTGGNGGDAGSVGYVPNTYLVVPINQQISFGLGISAPFGLKTEYDNGWIGQFQAIKSDVKTININPSLSWKVNDTVAFGFGVDYQKFDAELTNAVNFSGALCANAALAALCSGGLLNNVVGTGKVSGNDTAWGYNLGAIFQISPSTRVGVSYRSSIKYTVTGSVSFTRPTVTLSTPYDIYNTSLNAAIAAGAPDGPVKLDIKMPDTAIISAYQRLNDNWEMLGDLSWTGWAKIPSLDINRASGTPLSTTKEGWRDTWRVAFGGNYRYNDRIKIRFGLAYDQSPVSDTYRTPRLPDNNRTWISIGAQYALTKTSTFDWGYAHLFVKDAPINTDNADLNKYGLVNGNYKDSVDIFGVQYAVNF
jgi:long-chain fatty acid transport protein